MGIIDSAAISVALASSPSLRANLRQLVQQLSRDRFCDNELAMIERELVASLRIKEASQLPGSLPRPGQSLKLTKNQLRILSAILERFRDASLREKCQGAVRTAVSEGRIAAV